MPPAGKRPPVENVGVIMYEAKRTPRKPLEILQRIGIAAMWAVAFILGRKSS
jgi:hypothetical protein